ncbi:EscU/YscU/HrcU family type III secretion system export apparatus switch protein [Reinekea thalattae]|uniref:Flagellar biosynthesis protein FlhB n=1 Tax=Reinekea thalattae TaxID=2593301 RepID=A0A5C8Z8Q6_9GAMM|nr:EscU/YscU/HrcU family type III secretion system export apparatus switch protein [Reinekea thalattae]TXR53734.1 flagellar biosynthesis protein FlhB [Reinekea thalattae]
MTDVSKAATLKYRDRKTPIVSAVGENQQAEAILALAKEHQVPVYEDPELVNLLCQIDVGRAVPAELFEWVASAIAFSFFARNEVPEGFSPTATKTAYDRVKKTYTDNQQP